MVPARVNGADLFHEAAGAGEPLVLVHGSWVDRLTAFATAAATQ